MHYVKATFIKRINRFLVECQLDGRIITAHMPNPGRLWELLFPGKEVYLKPREGENRPVLWAIRKNDSIICLHTHYTNLVAEKLLKEGAIQAFRDYKIVTKEFPIGQHRIDFLLSKNNEQLLLEVKSCTLFYDTIAMFPDAVTLRGKKHLELLAKHNGAVLFIVNSPHVHFFLPDFHTDIEFSHTLHRLKDHLTIKAVSIKWDENLDFHFCKELDIPWHIYESEGKDRGCYLITGLLKNDQTIEVGSLGILNFKKGYYLYTGSAMKNLSARIKRHLSSKKKIRWHIDYLLPHLGNIKAIPIRTSQKYECFLADSVKSIASESIKNFGSSDCSCLSHLFYFRENPFLSERFLEILLNFRIGMLQKFISIKGEKENDEHSMVPE